MPIKLICVCARISMYKLTKTYHITAVTMHSTYLTAVTSIVKAFIVETNSDQCRMIYTRNVLHSL